jgi:hypothetical protein
MSLVRPRAVPQKTGPVRRINLDDGDLREGQPPCAGLSDTAAKLLARTRDRCDLSFLLVEMIEAGEIDVIEAMLVVRELRASDLVILEHDPEQGPQFRWAYGSRSVN